MEAIVLLALPGFVAVWSHRLFARRRSRAGWDFLILTGLAGLAAYYTAALISAVLDGRIDSGEWGVNLAPAMQLDGAAYVLSFPVAVLMGPLSWIVLYHPLVTRFLVHICRVQHPPSELDIPTRLSRIATPVVASMDSGQVYIGIVEAVTTDPDEKLKLLTLAYFLSGRRSEAHGQPQVRYTYRVEYDKDAPSLIYLDFRNVVSVAEFNLASFLKGFRDGYVSLPTTEFVEFLVDLEKTGIPAGVIDGELERFSTGGTP